MTNDSNRQAINSITRDKNAAVYKATAQTRSLIASLQKQEIQARAMAEQYNAQAFAARIHGKRLRESAQVVGVHLDETDAEMYENKAYQLSAESQNQAEIADHLDEEIARYETETTLVGEQAEDIFNPGISGDESDDR